MTCREYCFFSAFIFLHLRCAALFGKIGGSCFWPLHLARRAFVSFPRTKEAYRKIAEFFEVDINYLLTEEEEFVVQASEQYGSRGMQEAQELIHSMSGLFAGGSLSEQDKDAVMKALQDIYWESKARNVQKYTPKKYQKQD